VADVLAAEDWARARAGELAASGKKALSRGAGLS
jgi:hypothetical protein